MFPRSMLQMGRRMATSTTLPKRRFGNATVDNGKHFDAENFTKPSTSRRNGLIIAFGVPLFIGVTVAQIPQRQWKPHMHSFPSDGAVLKGQLQ